MDKTSYIHYGSTGFDPERGFPIKNARNWSKPVGGLWASRKDASCGWKEWCAEEDYKECVPSNSFEFTLADGSNVARISNRAQLHQLPKIEDAISVFYNIDFEKCVQMGIDAIELCWFGDEFKDEAGDNLYCDLSCWDCDSIVILNPNVVIQISGGNPMKCEICGKEIEGRSYFVPGICSDKCQLEGWRREWYNNHKEHPDKYIVCNGQRYHLGDEDSKSGFRGFGGRTFHIQFLDTGKIVTTTNLWHNGDIPDAWKERLPDTVKFLSEAEYIEATTGKTSIFNP